MESYSKKNQVKHGKYGSITLGDKKTLPPRPEIYRQNLSTQHLVVKGSKK